MHTPSRDEVEGPLFGLKDSLSVLVLLGYNFSSDQQGAFESNPS